MSTTEVKREMAPKNEISFYGPVMIIGAAFMLFFGYVVPPFGGITDLGMKMLGVLIGLIFITCLGGDLLGGSLLALVMTVFHGYYSPTELLGNWLGSASTVQLVFCGALCLALRESGAMDIVAKKLLGNKLTLGRPLATLMMLFIATYVVAIFIAGAPIYILFFGLLESIRDVCGYDKDDPFLQFALLGIYIGAMGLFFFAWKSPQVMTIALIESLMEPYGVPFSSGVWMATQAISFLSFLVIYAILMKTVFKLNLEPLAKLDISKVDKLKDVPDTFNRKQKIIIAIILLCIAYIIICTILPKTIPHYEKITGFGATWIWVIAAMLCSAVRPRGSKQGFLPMPRLLSQSSLWVMISLVGALRILGEVTSDADLGVRTWLIDLLSPLFGNMNIWGLMAAVVLFATLVTQISNGLVLTMAICPVITPFVCELALTTGINPSVILTVVNCCANVAYLTVAGSVNAAYLFARPEINQRFIWTKGVIVMCIYMVWQYIVGMVLTFVF
jgi:sodium-dependent dicarboxylate transporter 2/3/5